MTNANEDTVVESRIMRLSVRSVLVIVLTATVCAMSIASKEIKEPLYTLAGMAIGWYFGQKKT